MSDDRFARADEDDEAEAVEEPAHRIFLQATVDLEWDGRAWQVAEPARLVYDAQPQCNGGWHAASPAERARCDIEKERANGAVKPTRAALAEAFRRAAEQWPPEPVRT